MLQRLNDFVFKRPADVDRNISSVAEYLKQCHPGYRFAAPIASTGGHTLLRTENGCYRAFPFIAGSHTVNAVQTPEQAFEAAKQFGGFTARLKDFDAAGLCITIPHFHDLSVRYKRFLQSTQKGNPQRIKNSADLTGYLQSQSVIVSRYEALKKNPAFRLRVTHHDTKINNVLFDERGKGLCVIDLDTVMPGYFISDAGDMMRTYLSPVTEEESDLEKVTIRNGFYEAVTEGYLSEMGGELTDEEKQAFGYAGLFAAYMQSVRFLTDYLTDDVYYGAAYPDQNLTRARNQTALLREMQRLTAKG